MGRDSQRLENLLSEKELQQIIQWYKNENVSLRELARRTSHSRSALTAMLERLGIKTTKGNHYRHYFFDFDFFETIDNELKAYWLGFLYADGCIFSPREYGEQEFQLSLAQKDEEMIHLFKQDLKSTYPIFYDNSHKKKNPTHQTMVRQVLRSQKTVNDLKRLGCIENKSLVLKFPALEQVPEQFIRHFIRGYFDGDGSISITTEPSGHKTGLIQIVGTENFITDLSKHFPNMGSIIKDKRKTNSWYFSIGGNYKIMEVYHYFYDGATRFMPRKFEKFKTIIEQYDDSQGENNIPAGC